MRAWLALAALVATTPALATSGVPLGRFGGWELSSSPPMLPPAGQPMPPMRYSASFGDDWNSPWDATSRIMFSPQGAEVTTFGGGCILRERVAAAGGRSRDPAVLMEVLLRQARHVEPCGRKADAPDVFQRQMRASMPDLRRMLKRLREVSAGGGRTARPASPGRRDVRSHRLARLGKIARGCGLPAQTLKLEGEDQLHVQPSPDASYESVDCLLRALRKAGMPLKMGFVGSEAHVTENRR